MTKNDNEELQKHLSTLEIINATTDLIEVY